MTTTTILFLALLGLSVWAWLPLPLSRKHHTRHHRNVLARVAERRTNVVFWMLRRKFVTKGD
jgi:hypothetical protein